MTLLRHWAGGTRLCNNNAASDQNTSILPNAIVSLEETSALTHSEVGSVCYDRENGNVE